MNAATIEKRVFQVIVAFACLIPIITGAQGILDGPGFLHGGVGASVDLDSHFRYVSGIFFGVGLCFASCVPAIETKGARFRMLGFLVVCGGLARLLSWIEHGAPSKGHQLGLVMELGVVPLLMIWQAQMARRNRSV